MAQFLAGVLTTLAVIAVWQHFTLQPRSDLTWIEEQSRTTTATTKDEFITLTNVRDWTYTETGPATKEWKEVTVDPREIKQVWFIIEPFSRWKAVGHTFLSFEFTDGTTLAFSVEARREEGEAYHAFDGLLRRYELTYQWGTERDFIARRLVYLNHPVRMYPLILPEGTAERLFRSLTEETNELAASPRFYNTFMANCTNILADIVNEHYPGTLPRHYAWVLTGYSDTYLMREEFIPLVDASEKRTQQRFDLTPLRESIGYAALLDPVSFSEVLRISLSERE